MLANKWTWSAALMVILPAAMVHAEAPATQPAATQPDSLSIPALVAQMGSPKFQTRQRAQKALVQIGLPAEPALRDAAHHSTSAEIRSRAKAAMEKIEDDQPDSPSRVTIKAVNEDPGRVLRAMADQAGVSIVAENPGMWGGFGQQIKPITLDLDRVPLLVGLENFCKATHSRPFTNGGGPDPSALLLNSGDTGVWDQEDRVAAVANQIGHDRDIDLSNNATNRRDFVGLSFFFDPKRQLIGYEQPTLKVAVDENGNSYLANGGGDDPANEEQDNEGFDNNPFISHWGFDAQIPLNFPAKPGKTLARLEGTVTIRVATKIDKLDIRDLTKAVGSAVVAGNRKVEVLAFNFNGGVANVHIRVTDTGAAQNPIARFFVGGRRGPNLFGEFSKATFVDAAGAPLSCSSSTWSGSDTQLDWQGQFNSPGGQPLKGPISLRWNVITETKDIPVTFKFHNLALPPQ